ncbi:MAG TPA: glycerophosphodiester phosphodiesterase family protein [Thermomicrobiales bacterium]|nr:glycerophosphodiester phosphodiesterase family protein [Thermomicrobiales bacterium]
MIESDLWPFHGRLEIRHAKSLGPLPIYWEKWYIESIGRNQLQLAELVQSLPPTTPLFIDFKGTWPWLGTRAIEAIEQVQQGRQIIVCGRAWSQLDPIETLPNVHVFYSVGNDAELEMVWERLSTQVNPAISIHHNLLQPGTIARLNDLNVTIVAWTVNDFDLAGRLFQQGVDGFTSDNVDLLRSIVGCRERTFDHPRASNDKERLT